MSASARERRKYERYGTKVDIYFRVSYDISTKVKFQVQNAPVPKVARKYIAISRNISAEGLNFISKKQLEKGDKLYLEIYLPKAKEPIVMDGNVHWCAPVVGRNAPKTAFETGVKISSVQGQPVERSIYFDKTYQVTWSVLLESVLGNFRIISRRLSAQRTAKKT